MARVDRPPPTDARTRAGDVPRLERPGRVVGGIALLALAVVAGTLAGPWDPPLRNDDAPLPPPETPTDLPTLPDVDIIPPDLRDTTDVQPWDLTWLGVAVAVLLLAWALYAVRVWLRRHPAPRPPEAPDDAGIELGEAFTGPGTVVPDLPALRTGVAEAEAALRRFARPVDAVIAAWVRLEAAAARSGLRRDPASTPTEFTLRVLDAAPVDPRATRTLLDLYLRARFGNEHMTPADVTAAVAALAVLANGLGDPEDADTSDWRLEGSDTPLAPATPDDDGPAPGDDGPPPGDDGPPPGDDGGAR